MRFRTLSASLLLSLAACGAESGGASAPDVTNWTIHVSKDGELGWVQGDRELPISDVPFDGDRQGANRKLTQLVSSRAVTKSRTGLSQSISLSILFDADVSWWSTIEPMARAFVEAVKVDGVTMRFKGQDEATWVDVGRVWKAEPRLPRSVGPFTAFVQFGWSPHGELPNNATEQGSPTIACPSLRIDPAPETAASIGVIVDSLEQNCASSSFRRVTKMNAISVGLRVGTGREMIMARHVVAFLRPLVNVRVECLSRWDIHPFGWN